MKMLNVTSGRVGEGGDYGDILIEKTPKTIKKKTAYTYKHVSFPSSCQYSTENIQVQCKRAGTLCLSARIHVFISSFIIARGVAQKVFTVGTIIHQKKRDINKCVSCDVLNYRIK